jgi:zinc ribbon protein
MSASPVGADSCANCGASLPKDARFCPACGVQVDAGETMREAMPLEETGPVPVSVQHVEPRWFGVTPPNLLLGIAATAVAVAAILFVIGHWPYGLILLGVGSLLFAAYLEAARRGPESPLARASVDARERARSSWETMRARQAAAAELRRIQTAIAGIEPERRAAFHDLGTAAYRHDADAEADARLRLERLDAREAELRAELGRTHEHAGERIRLARLPVQETVMVVPAEPAPPPDEGTPPQPAVVPEPYPPPDEGDPPEPARVPEPSPDPEKKA